MFLYIALCFSVHGCAMESPPEAQPVQYRLKPNLDEPFELILEGAQRARIDARSQTRVLPVVAGNVVLDERAHEALLDEAARLYVDDHQVSYRLTHQIQHNCPLIERVAWSRDQPWPTLQLTLRQTTRRLEVFGDIDADPQTTTCGVSGRWCIRWSREDFLASVWSSPEPIYIDVHAHPRCQMTIDANVLRSDRYNERQK